VIASVRMIGFSGHIEISQDSVPLIGKALPDELGAIHGPFVGVTMMGPGADQIFARVVLETGGHLYVENLIGTSRPIPPFLGGPAPNTSSRQLANREGSLTYPKIFADWQAISM
jgi:hypothetical protein